MKRHSLIKNIICVDGIYYFKELAGARHRSIIVTLFPLIALALEPAEKADVLFLNDGSIILGPLVEARGTELIYDSLGMKVRVPGKSVPNTEKDLSSLGDRRCDVTLVDGMVFTGSIADYDPEIGLFIDLSMGSLTLPASGVKSIVDPQARWRWVGSDFSLTAVGSCVWFPDDDFFATSFSAGLGASARLPWRD